MNANLSAIRITITDEVGFEIIKSSDPLAAYRDYLKAEHKIDPKSITNYDLDHLRRAAVIALGEAQFAAMGLPVPAEKD